MIRRLSRGAYAQARPYLARNLPGYEAYTRKVPARLVPDVW